MPSLLERLRNVSEANRTLLCVGLDPDPASMAVPDRAGGDTRKVGEEELRSLSAFSDFIETLNLDDLGQPDTPSAEKS